ncbi:Cof-type HAD-IIB family hydrolase [Actinotalea sp. K2]|uniref:HAD family hydrolase n=1 Tax=Actinotalea sp. K2 TaxID=2939438 RepID=UPI002017CF22|nr:Cof-type HAD-IIB family hydrolase [Actinotalea sp. K2]MCL3862476.1 HAD family hydrolase [Actinotalea sp. K2]
MIPTDAPATFPTSAQAADLRLVVLDMDGTLLDGEKRVPEGFWPVAASLLSRGVVLCAASGRQQATLARMFGDLGDDLLFIAENGAHVVHHGRLVSAAAIDRPAVQQAVQAVRVLATTGARVGTVVSTTRSAYVESTDDAFLAEASRYYARLEQVEDLLAVRDDVLKVAVHDVGPVEESAFRALGPLAATHTLVLSGEHWTDLTHRGTTKGAALVRVHERLRISREQTVAFGDHLNDLEMLDAAGMSFAMANAHPQVLDRARYRAPSNLDDGVTRTLVELLRLADLDA